MTADHKIFATEWNLVLNIGIKCNAAPISQAVSQRYVSSPFDNMDSVLGLAEIGRILSERFAGYWEDRSKWHIRNDRASNRPEIRAKIAWNEDYPDLFFPHFYSGWIPGTAKEDIEQWIADENGTLDFVWDGLKQVYKTRQDRVVALLEAGNRVLFLRVDERTQLGKLARRDSKADSLTFCDAVKRAYPDLDFALLYLTSQRPEQKAEPFSNDMLWMQPMPADCNEPTWAADFLSQLKLHPREDLVFPGLPDGSRTQLLK